jgi:hypothetical protein
MPKTILQRINEILTDNYMEIEEIRLRANLTNDIIHVINAIKSGIQQGYIEKKEVPNVKTLYLGHQYRRSQL